MNRRRFLGAAASSTLFGCLSSAATPSNRLSVPKKSSVKPAPAGLHPLNCGPSAMPCSTSRSPPRSSKKLPWWSRFTVRPAARTAPSTASSRSPTSSGFFLLLAPVSESTTWDGIGGQNGPDPAFISRSLAKAFTMRAVDPARVAMAGFSDGASYSLSIGLANGDLFRAVFGFSPGFIIPGDRIGKPPVFISHGTIDNVLPIDQCSRRIVPELKRLGYNVTYREFEGKHTLPPEIASDAMRWFMTL